jgi:hypothetical protein
MAPEHPHDPPRRFAVPPVALLWRGIALFGIAAAAIGVSVPLGARHPFAAAPVYAALHGVALLAAWAALIHLTGGERFDDHDLL